TAACVWPCEARHEMMARAHKMDRVESRRKNILKKGMAQATGTPVNDAPLEAVLARIVARLNWGKPMDRGSGAIRRGRGLAIAIKAGIAPTTSVAGLNVTADRRPILHFAPRGLGPG